MDISKEGLRKVTQTPMGKKLMKYTVGSGISAVVSQIAFILSFGVFHFFGSHGSSIFATLTGAVPSYFLNRYWAWQRKTRSSLAKEVLPYLVMAVIGLIFSTWAADFANSHSDFLGSSAFLKLVWVDGAYFGSFAVLWLLKFMFLERFLFSAKSSQLETSSSSD